MIAKKIHEQINFNNICLMMVAIMISFYMIFGGILFYQIPIIQNTVMFVNISLIIAGASIAVIRKQIPPTTIIIGLLIIAMLISWVNSPYLIGFFLGLLSFYITAITIMIISFSIGSNSLISALEIAIWMWLIGWLIVFFGLKWQDNRNVISIWPGMAILLLLYQKRSIINFVPFILVIILLGSRGAILGLLVGVFIYLFPKISAVQRPAIVIMSFIFTVLLIFLRPSTVILRFEQWYGALSIMWNTNPLFGLGPGGIIAHQAIPELRLFQEGSPIFYHPHGHNIFVHITTEFGLIGLLTLITIILIIIINPPQYGWQVILLGGILAHGLVDYPFYFIGPIVVFSAVAGTFSYKGEMKTPSNTSFY